MFITILGEGKDPIAIEDVLIEESAPVERGYLFHIGGEGLGPIQASLEVMVKDQKAFSVPLVFGDRL
jgi:hypothetical protein